MDGVRVGVCQLRQEGRRVVGGVGPRRERDDLDLEALVGRELHPAQRRILAGGVGVEAEVEAPGQPDQLFQLAFGQRRPHRRDDGLEAGLPKREHVRVTFDDDRAIVLRNRAARLAQSVQEVAFPEDVALRRVDVLPTKRIVLEQLARLEADDSSSGVGEREHESPAEVVVAARGREPGRLELVERVALGERLLRQRRPAGRESDSELAADGLAETA